MASSSSSNLSKYDVFLSFRGEDTRDNFVSHLLRALETTKIPTFIDYELNKGDEINPALIRAIEVSKISVIIFSENYADSRWCLDELLKILECMKELKQIVIPVFYKVKPRDVRKQTGKFGAAFLKNITASKSGKEQIWRNALREASNLSGCDSSTIGSTLCRSEAILVDTIIAHVLKKLETGSNNSYVDRGILGIDSRMEQIIGLLRIESPPWGFRMVGIWGMGGIGKTTIAKAVFNKISSEFESCCFLGNVRVKAKTEGLPSIRKDLICELLKVEKSSYGLPYTRDRLRRTRALILLDDLNDSLQLEGLIGASAAEKFGPGSRVIVTTRDKQVLSAHETADVYNMDILNDDDASKLFMYHAFGQKQPLEHHLKFSEQMVVYAKGVPLALEVLGSSLRGKTSLFHWKGALRKLRKVPDPRISDVLKISYDSLGDEEKNIFLDIACFFRHIDIDTVRNDLDCCYHSLHSGMDVLLDKSLISYKNLSGLRGRNGFYVVEMHDLVQEMGWNIVIGESKNAGSRSRLWRPEDVRDVLTRNTGTENVKGLLLNTAKVEVNKMSLAPETFKKMYNLKFLKIIDSVVYPKFQFPNGLKSLPDGLRYLHWGVCQLEYWPPTFNPNYLVELHLNANHLKRLWRGKKNLYNLKTMELWCCLNLTEIPDLSLARNLEKLKIAHCPLVYIRSSIKKLNNLTHLKLDGCQRLVEIPSYIQHFNNLTHLNFSRCNRLVEIPSFIQYLKNLINFELCGCTELERIPNDINCISLRDLNLVGCTKIIKIPYLSKNITSLYVDGSLVERDLSSIATFTELVSLTLWKSTDYQKSPAFLKRIKILTPSHCEIFIW